MVNHPRLKYVKKKLAINRIKRFYKKKKKDRVYGNLKWDYKIRKRTYGPYGMYGFKAPGLFFRNSAAGVIQRKFRNRNTKKLLMKNLDNCYLPNRAVKNIASYF